MFVIVYIPAIAALFLWIACRHAGELTAKSGTILAIWYIAGLYLQLLGGSPMKSVGGLVLLSILGVYLSLKLKAGI